ncbi:DUF4384 domain-containing protein [candidate division WOR-3 bacterium]|nr:DUF4384 domain-containing protein [candidate division WOR-3 bacterium]
MKRLLFFLLSLFVLFANTTAQEEYNLEIDVSVDKGDEAVYYDEEPIFISFRTTENAYVIIYDIDTDGNLHLIFPEREEGRGFIRANRTYQIPADNDDYSLRIKGPPGEEFICAVASTEPLRIPAVFRGEEESQFKVEGDPEKAIENITEDILEGNRGAYATDICYLYVECPFPPPPLYCAVEIVSKPSGAKIYLNGRYFGRTPAVITGIPPGVHRLVLNKKCYYRYMREIVLGKGERERVKVRLKWKLW